MIALSTSWSSRNHTDGYAMLAEIAEMGFGAVELSHNIRASLVPGIVKAVKEGVIQVASVHNFCPLPYGFVNASPNAYTPTAWNPLERYNWVQHTHKSLLLASSLGAKALVCHIGSVQFLWGDPVAKLKQLQNKRVFLELLQDQAYQNALQATLNAISKKAPSHLKKAQHCISRILPIAQQHHIQIGIENREGLLELPLDRSIADFVQRFDYAPGAVRYWHDTGHAKLKEQMGLLNHEKHLEANAAHLIGFHLHDTTLDGKDHQPIGHGVINFKRIAQYIQPQHLLTLELSARATKAEVMDSHKRLLDYIRPAA